MDEPVSIGFIGLGVMGEPMCRNLCLKLCGGGDEANVADELLSISVFDVFPEKAAGFSKLGAAVCASIAEVAKDSQVILLSLPGGDELEQVLCGKGGVFDHAQRDAIIVDLSTSPVALTRTLADQAMERGLGYVDSPVARTRKAAETGTLAMSVGGEMGAVQRVLPLLECMATDIMHVGEVGNGQLVKILNNMVLFQTVSALSEAKALAGAAGMDAETLFAALQQGSANSFALEQHGIQALLPEKFPEQAFSVNYAKKDLAYALDLSDSTNTPIAGARHIDALFERAINQGKGELYWPVIGTLEGE